MNELVSESASWDQLVSENNIDLLYNLCIKKSGNSTKADLLQNPSEYTPLFIDDGLFIPSQFPIIVYRKDDPDTPIYMVNIEQEVIQRIEGNYSICNIFPINIFKMSGSFYAPHMHALQCINIHSYVCHVAFANVFPVKNINNETLYLIPIKSGFIEYLFYCFMCKEFFKVGIEKSKIYSGTGIISTCFNYCEKHFFLTDKIADHTCKDNQPQAGVCYLGMLLRDVKATQSFNGEKVSVSLYDDVFFTNEQFCNCFVFMNKNTQPYKNKMLLSLRDLCSFETTIHTQNGFHYTDIVPDKFYHPKLLCRYPHLSIRLIIPDNALEQLIQSKSLRTYLKHSTILLPVLDD